MRALLQAALDLGWTLVAYEAQGEAPESEDPMASVNWREAEQARNLLAALEGLGDDGRLLVWCGNSHLDEAGGLGPGGVPFLPMGRQLRELGGIDPFTIDQTVSVDFDGSGQRPREWLRRSGDALNASPELALGLLAPEDAGVDSQVVSLDNELR